MHDVMEHIKNQLLGRSDAFVQGKLMQVRMAILGHLAKVIQASFTAMLDGETKVNICSMYCIYF